MERDPNQATSQPMGGGGIGGTDEGRDRDVGDDIGSKGDTGDVEFGGDNVMDTRDDPL